MSIPGVNSRFTRPGSQPEAKFDSETPSKGQVMTPEPFVSLQADLADTDAHLESLRGRRADIKRRNRTSLLDGQSPRPAAVDVGELEGSLPVLRELTERPSEQEEERQRRHGYPERPVVDTTTWQFRCWISLRKKNLRNQVSQSEARPVPLQIPWPARSRALSPFIHAAGAKDSEKLRHWIE